MQDAGTTTMGRIGNPPLISTIGTATMSFQEGNPKVWVQLGEEPRNTNIDILVIVQELKDEMAWISPENKRLMQEQEKNMKSLPDRQNN